MNDIMKINELIKQSEINRRRLIEVIYNAKAGHIGGDLSCLSVRTDLNFGILNVNAADPKNTDRDRFVLSKGHCVEALYVTLESKGFLKKEVLDTLGQYGSVLSGHPTIEVSGIEGTTGAPVAPRGDGEQGEGSIYEAAMAGNQYHLDNLVAIIDRNHLQISGNTENVMGIDNIHDRWSAFGWDVKTMNGDDMQSIIDTFNSIDYTNGKPHLLVSETTKGKGVSFMENIAKWHHGVPSQEQYEAAMKEITERIDNL